MTRALMLAVVLTACGGGTGESSVMPCQPTIQLFGDSTTASQVGSGPLWIERWGSRITNRSVNGAWTTALRNGTDKLNMPWPGSVSAQYAIISLGLNDAYVPDTAYTPLAKYIENLRFFADNPGAAEVIFQTPLPTFAADRPVAPYAQAMRDVAAEKGLKLIDMFSCFQANPGWQAMLPDKVHPNDAGKVRMFECAAPVVEALVCK